MARTPDPTHGRIIQIRLTGAGTAVLAKGDAKVAEVEGLMFPEMSNEEYWRLHTQLRAAVKALSVQGV